MGYDIDAFPERIRQRMQHAYNQAAPPQPDKPKTVRGNPEANIQTVITSYAQLHRIRTTHIPTSTANYTTYEGDGALPDLILGYHGQTWMLEIKAPGNKPRPNRDPARCQVTAIEQFGAYWTDSADAGMRMVDCIVQGNEIRADATRKLN